MEILKHLEKKTEIWFLLGISFIFFLFRLPSLFEPYWYGDEGIYQAMADSMNSGRLLFEQVWDNKPPLLYVMYAIFNGDQFTLRLVSLLFGLGAVITFFFISQKLFQKRQASYIATSFFALLFALPYIEGNIANAENFILFPVLLAFLFLLKLFSPSELQSKQEAVTISPLLSRKLFFPGVLLGLAFLIKIVVLFDTAAFFVILFFFVLREHLSLRKLPEIFLSFIMTIRFAILGFLTPVFLTALYFFLKGSFVAFFTASFLGNINYVGYNNSLIIPQGFLILKLTLLAAALVFLFIKHKKMPFALTIILSWLCFSVFNVFFAQRPYPHYLLILLPSFSLLLGAVISFKSFRIYLGVLCITLFFFINSVFHVTRYRNPIFYYTNFLQFIAGQKSIPDYYAYFDGNVNRNYAIADYLKIHTNPNDIVFIWGNSAQIYHMSQTLSPGKYVVAYHVSNTLSRQETEIDISKTRPRFIVIQSDISSYPFPLDGYGYKVTIFDNSIYEKVY